MSETKPPRKAGCENCRARHVKCEGGLPCVRCNKRGLDCSKEPATRFRHSSISGQALRFPSRQIWCNTSGRKLEFVDQTLETTRHYYDGYESEDNLQSSPCSAPSDDLHEQERTSSLHDSAAVDIDPHIQDVEFSRSSIVSDCSQLDRNTHIVVRSFGESSVDTPNSNDSVDAHIQCFPDLRPGLELDADAATRNTLRSFVESIGPSIDPCDSYTALAVDIVERALSHSELLPLLRYLEELQGFSVATSPHASPRASVLVFDQANPLLSAFLLRLIDNLQGLAKDSTTFDNPKLIHEALNNLDLCSQDEPRFVHQLVWASLRQELFIALTSHEVTFVDLDIKTLQNIPSISEDEEWTHKILLQLIKAVQYCFGDNKSSAVYDQHVEDLALWMQSKPSWFTPIFSRPPQEGRIFPEILLLSDFAAVACQYYHLVRILLVEHNPRMPGLGPAKRAVAKWRDKQVKNDVKIICGIAMSRASIDPMHLAACMAIAMAGDRFTDPRERASLFSILVNTQQRYGWSTTAAQNYLKDAWELP